MAMTDRFNALVAMMQLNGWVLRAPGDDEDRGLAYPTWLELARPDMDSSGVKTCKTVWLSVSSRNVLSLPLRIDAAMEGSKPANPEDHFNEKEMERIVKYALQLNE